MSETTTNSDSRPLVRVLTDQPPFSQEYLCYGDNVGQFFETESGEIVLATKVSWVIVVTSTGHAAYAFDGQFKGLRPVTLEGITVRA